MRRVRSRDEDGAAIVETVLILTVVLMMLLAGFEFGRGFNAYLTVTDAARDGARVALDATKTNTDVRNAAIAAAAPLAVTVPEPLRVGGTTWVTVTYNFSPMIGLLGPFTMSKTAVAK